VSTGRRINATRLLLGAVAVLSAVTLGLAAFMFRGVLFPRDQSATLPVAARLQGGTPTSGVSGFTSLEQPHPMPELQFVDGEGHALTLAEFRGRVVLLNIWATWCVPCRKEMPTLDRLQAKLGSRDFQVVALSIDRAGIPPVSQFYKELGLTALGTYVDQSGKAAGSLGTVGIPTTLLVDRDGQEVARKVGPAEWDSPEVIALIRRQLRTGSADAAAGQSGADVK
jgi:thiol-disulfide isomerase/thioredoxin